MCTCVDFMPELVAPCITPRASSRCDKAPHAVCVSNLMLSVHVYLSILKLQALSSSRSPQSSRHHPHYNLPSRLLNQMILKQVHLPLDHQCYRHASQAKAEVSTVVAKEKCCSECVLLIVCTTAIMCWLSQMCYSIWYLSVLTCSLDFCNAINRQQRQGPVHIKAQAAVRAEA